MVALIVIEENKSRPLFAEKIKSLHKAFKMLFNIVTIFDPQRPAIRFLSFDITRNTYLFKVFKVRMGKVYIPAKRRKSV